APIGILFFVLYKTFILVDGILKPLILKVFDVNIPGLGIIILFFTVVVLGYIGQTIIAKPVSKITNKLLKRLPLIKIIYSSIKDLLSAFVGKEKKFNKPVIVKVNNISNLEKLGFLTEEDLSVFGIEGGKVSVYFPHSYNFSGEMFIVPVKDVRLIDNKPSDVMKFIVSGGVTNINNEFNKSDLNK
ncbi:MAG: DUF502 domain-containing protein, partial [Bacteroidales bacterium]|nr:DUF502 domain-containing protein [Bacteroidales bacterium]